MEEVGNVVRMEVASSGNYWECSRLILELKECYLLVTRGCSKTFFSFYEKLSFPLYHSCHVFSNKWSFYRLFCDELILKLCHILAIPYDRIFAIPNKNAVAVVRKW